MKFALRIVLMLGAIALTIFGLLLMAGALDSSGSDAAGRGLSQAYGMFIALLGGAAVLSLLLTRFWRGFLVIGALFLSLPFVLMLLLSIGRSVEERRNDQFTADVHSGRYNFGEHPELLAVAEAIAKNDTNAIRASAKKCARSQRRRTRWHDVALLRRKRTARTTRAGGRGGDVARG